MVGISGELNAYGYVSNNPVKYTDARGLGSFGSLEGWTVYKGLRAAGKTPEEASQMMVDGAKAEAAIGAAMFATGVLIGVGCMAASQLAGAAAGSGGTWTTQYIVRQAVGRDGGISVTLKERLNGVTVSIRHIVVKGGEIIHDHITHVGKHGGTRVFPPEWTGK
jgi:hypothetical protein